MESYKETSSNAVFGSGTREQREKVYQDAESEKTYFGRLSPGPCTYDAKVIHTFADMPQGRLGFGRRFHQWCLYSEPGSGMKCSNLACGSCGPVPCCAQCFPHWIQQCSLECLRHKQQDWSCAPNYDLLTCRAVWAIKYCRTCAQILQRHLAVGSASTTTLSKEQKSSQAQGNTMGNYLHVESRLYQRRNLYPCTRLAHLIAIRHGKSICHESMKKARKGISPQDPQPLSRCDSGFLCSDK